MTDEELAAIKARADAAATPGPWSADFTDDTFTVRPDNGCTIRGGERDDVIVACVEEADNKADILFITHARTDISALLADVKAWRAIGRSLADAELIADDNGLEGLCVRLPGMPPDSQGEARQVQAQARMLLGLPDTAGEGDGQP